MPGLSNIQTQVQTQTQIQTLSPQQVLEARLLALSTLELEEHVRAELGDNPALEDGPAELSSSETDDSVQDDDMEYGTEQYSNQDDNNRDDWGDDDDDWYDRQPGGSGPVADIPLADTRSFYDILYEQLREQDLTARQMKIALYIIGSIDNDGILDKDLQAISDDLAFYHDTDASVDEIEQVLKVIQEFDPAGIGARNLQECLLIQLKRLQEENPYLNLDLSITIVNDFFEEFTKKHYDKIAKKLEVSNRELKAALDEILKLNPKPADASSASTKNIHYITPDFFIFVRDGKVELSLDGRNAPELRVSKSYINMLEEFSNSKDSRSKQEAVQFVKQKIDAAKWFIDAINQRQTTLYKTMKAIVEMQEEYFITGDEAKLKPMILKDVAEKVGLDISTISRVANSKYVQTPYGTFMLKFFFSEGIKNEGGEEVSTREIKKILKDCVENEDKAKPMTDEQLMLILKEKGYPIARRTVAKYREQLGIPVGRMRKKI
jgi:RNA polymerase sigma-54 factor